MFRNLPLLFLLFSYLLFGCDKPLFTQLTASQTGIAFSNRITENDTMNIIDFEYIYNGGGVGLGDFNNDGRTDVFFTGNQVPCRLYLNQTESGSDNLRFEDITTKANLDTKGRWCSGVAVVDINNDGWLDIYVGATVKKSPADRRNLLFVNQGRTPGSVPIFREMAGDYGIADDGHTTNAAFFDYDNDGDLDLYVLTNTIDLYPNAYRSRVSDGSSPTTDRLYRNDFNAALGHPVFTNVSKAEGIQIEGYGLGINITDINGDGWRDVYVTNDYLSDDLLYINNHNGSRHLNFVDRAAESLKHTSNSAMGNDVADLNNDGLMDIVAVDMLPRDNYRKKMLMGSNNYQTYLNNDQYGKTYQYVRNTLQLNQGIPGGVAASSSPKMPVFSEVGLLADVAETDWSWSPSAVDFDNDGHRDLLITNGFPKDITDRDFMSFRAQSSSVAPKSFLLEQIPIVKISNYAFKNNGGAVPAFTDVTERWGLNRPSFSNGAAYGDLDNDGDLDYVVNNINDSAFVFRNNLIENRTDTANYLRINFAGPSLNRAGLGAFVEIRYKNTDGSVSRQVYEHSPYRGYLSSMEPIAHFGLGAVNLLDEVRIIWPATALKPACQQTLRQVRANQVLTVRYEQATEAPAKHVQPQPLFTDITDSAGITYQHSEPEYIDFNNQKLLPHKFSQFGPAVAVGDINGDGLDDAFIGGSFQNKGRFLIQTANGTFKEADLLPEVAIPALYGGSAKDKVQEDMGVLLFDADRDGDTDLYIASGSCEGKTSPLAYQDKLYVNTGNSTDGLPRFVLAVNALPVISASKSCVKAIDYDRDGDLDLFVGGRVEPDKYPMPVSSYILQNNSLPGKPQFVDITKQIAPELAKIGLICDALWTDPDNDGWPDLLLAGEFMPITLFRNQHGKSFVKTPNPELDKAVGWWNSLVAGDFDRDGDTDYLAGNLGLNSRMRASDQEPVRVYAGDFDKNGFYDAIPTVYIPDETGNRREFTFHGRDDLIKQMIGMRRQFRLYKDFASADIAQLLKPEERLEALVLSANEFRSMYLENKGVGEKGQFVFAMKPLPIEAQLAPIFGMVATDADQDGQPDVLLIGNDYSAEVSMGRYDGLNGLWLKGDGNGNFNPQSLAASGFYAPGNAKALVQLSDSKGQQLIIASQNRGPLRVLRSSKQPLHSVSLEPTDSWATLLYSDGRKQRVELSYGQSFLSQSGRSLAVGKGVKAIQIQSGKAERRLTF